MEMAEPITRTMGQGTINAIREVRVDTTSTTFALVLPDDGSGSRLAIRIGLNITADGDDCFLVGDKVKYTLLMGPAGAFPKAQDLVKVLTLPRPV
jgi:hypothetical protein